MDERKAEKILTDVIFSELNEAEKLPSTLNNITPDLLLSVCRLAKKHDLAHIVSSFAFRFNLEMDEALKASLQKEELLSVYRCEQLKYTFSEICSVLDEIKVAYLPLKGSVIRPYYPSERMRTSCDIDVMIHEEDLPKATQALEKKGYTFEKRSYHDVSLYSPNKIHLELHFNILENTEFLDVVLRDAWNYAELQERSRYSFTDEFFVFHMHAHMAYHFLAGGCGVRALMDIWVMENKMNLHFSSAEALLTKAGIYTFAKEMSNISNRCFTQNAEDGFSDLVLKYIFKGGVYGSIQNNVAVYKSKNKSTFAFLIKRLFLPYKTMKEIYPVLRKLPFLLPIFWVVRWVRALLGGKSKRFVSELSASSNVSGEIIAETREICSKLGFENLNK